MRRKAVFDQNRKMGVGLWKNSFDNKTKRHWKPLSLESGYWVCQDLWELKGAGGCGSGISHFEKYRERSGQAKMGNFLYDIFDT